MKKKWHKPVLYHTSYGTKLDEIDVKLLAMHTRVKRILDDVVFPNGRDAACDNIDRLASAHRMFEEVK